MLNYSLRSHNTNLKFPNTIKFINDRDERVIVLSMLINGC